MGSATVLKIIVADLCIRIETVSKMRRSMTVGRAYRKIVCVSFFYPQAEMPAADDTPRDISARTAMAALRPLIAMTLPPGWVQAPHR